MRLAVSPLSWLLLSVMSTLYVTELLPAAPFKAWITDKSWRSNNGQCAVFVQWTDYTSSSQKGFGKFFVGLRCEDPTRSRCKDTTRSLKGSEVQQSDLDTVKEHLAFTINHLVGKMTKGEKVPKGLLPLLKPPAARSEEDEAEESALPDLDDSRVENCDDGEEECDGGRVGSKRPRRSVEATTRDHYVAAPANDSPMQYQRRRDERDAGYDKELFGEGLLDPRSFLHAAIALPDPQQKAASMSASVADTAMKGVKGLMALIKGQLDAADEERDDLEDKLAEAEACALRSRLKSRAATCSPMRPLRQGRQWLRFGGNRTKREPKRWRIESP